MHIRTCTWTHRSHLRIHKHLARAGLFPTNRYCSEPPGVFANAAPQDMAPRCRGNTQYHHHNRGGISPNTGRS
eukprot:1087244-Lingulodinium_polyedra.AAC.1